MKTILFLSAALLACSVQAKGGGAGHTGHTGHTAHAGYTGQAVTHPVYRGTVIATTATPALTQSDARMIHSLQRREAANTKNQAMTVPAFTTAHYEGKF